MSEIKGILIHKLPHLKEVILSLSNKQLELMYSKIENKEQRKNHNQKTLQRKTQNLDSQEEQSSP